MRRRGESIAAPLAFQSRCKNVLAFRMTRTDRSLPSRYLSERRTIALKPTKSSAGDPIKEMMSNKLPNFRRIRSFFSLNAS